MKKKVYFIDIARNSKDFFEKGKKGIQLAMLDVEEPNKDKVRALLEATLGVELAKQHIPFNGKTTEKKQKRRNELKELYCDYLDSVNKTHYRITAVEVKA